MSRHESLPAGNLAAALSSAVTLVRTWVVLDGKRRVSFETHQPAICSSWVCLPWQKMDSNSGREGKGGGGDYTPVDDKKHPYVKWLVAIWSPGNVTKPIGWCLPSLWPPVDSQHLQSYKVSITNYLGHSTFTNPQCFAALTPLGMGGVTESLSYTDSREGETGRYRSHPS